MTANPAIHRLPSGDVDIALVTDDTFVQTILARPGSGAAGTTPVSPTPVGAGTGSAS